MKDWRRFLDAPLFYGDFLRNTEKALINRLAIR